MTRAFVKRNPCLAAVLQELESAGITTPIVEAGKHWKVHWLSPSGQHRLVSISTTPSDWHADRKARAVARRILRRDQSAGQRP